ncbi:MAG: ABC transporter permease subunit [archaeon]
MANKYKRSYFFGVHANPTRGLSVFLRSFLFIILVVTYLVASNLRHVENPADKLMPPPSKMVESMIEMTSTKDITTDGYVFWDDTYSSLRRLLLGLALSMTLGFFLGLNMGLLPGIRESSLSFITFVSNIPPLSILPILLIVFGVDELSKVVLIFIGTCPFIARDVYRAVRNIPKELIVKAQTLKASQFGLAYRVVTPQVLPSLLESTRLTLGSTWLFLIASEAIAASEGLGYRIYLSTRYLSMDVIIPYVLWITLLAFILDRLLFTWIKSRYKWYITNR